MRPHKIQDQDNFDEDEESNCNLIGLKECTEPVPLLFQKLWL